MSLLGIWRKYPDARICDRCWLQSRHRAQGLHRPSDLERFVLIHLQGETADPSWVNWPGWAEKHGLEGGHFQEGPRFTQSAMALQAAVEGQGVALCGITYALEDVLADNLCAPFGTDCAIQTRYAYDMVYTPARAEHPAVLAFRRWMKYEVKKSQQRIADYLACHISDAG